MDSPILTCTGTDRPISLCSIQCRVWGKACISQSKGIYFFLLCVAQQLPQWGYSNQHQKNLKTFNFLKILPPCTSPAMWLKQQTCLLGNQTLVLSLVLPPSFYALFLHICSLSSSLSEGTAWAFVNIFFKCKSSPNLQKMQKMSSHRGSQPLPCSSS